MKYLKTSLLSLLFLSALFTPNYFSKSSLYLNALTQISTWEDLMDVRNNLSEDYVLMNDLDQNSPGYASSTSGSNWTPIGLNPSVPFTGTFDGGGFEISDVVLDGTGQFYGFFGVIVGGSVSNLDLTNLTVTHDSNVFVGGLVGTGNDILIDNVTVTGTIDSLSGTEIGGLIGSSAQVSASNEVTITDSSFQGTISGDSPVGGLIGSSYGVTTITDSFSTGSINSSGTTGAGGLIGVQYGSTEIFESYSQINVTSGASSGGLVGQSLDPLEISNSYSTGDIDSSDSNYAGGLVGNGTGVLTVSNSYSTGNVEGATYVGGLSGTAIDGSNITSSYSTGNITATGDSVGGLLGEFYGDSITNSYSEGAVQGADYVGGLVGGIFGSTSIAYSYALGNVIGNDYVGGFLGSYSEGLISNSYAIGEVEGNASVGGFIGELLGDGSINKAYSAGLVTANSGFGGFVGDNYGVITESFWDVNTSGLTNGYGDQSSGGAISAMDLTGLSTLLMKTLSSFVDWDMSVTSTDLNNGYPFLAWQDDEDSFDWLIFESPADDEDEDQGNETNSSASSAKKGTTIQGRVKNLISFGNFERAIELIMKFPQAFDLPSNLNLETSLPDGTSKTTEYEFYRDLDIGSRGEDVRQLQILLNTKGYTLADSGPGSPGNETTMFGTLTKEALIRFQKENAIRPSVGYFGLITREYVTK